MKLGLWALTRGLSVAAAPPCPSSPATSSAIKHVLQPQVKLRALGLCSPPHAPRVRSCYPKGSKQRHLGSHKSWVHTNSSHDVTGQEKRHPGLVEQSQPGLKSQGRAQNCPAPPSQSWVPGSQVGGRVKDLHTPQGRGSSCPHPHLGKPHHNLGSRQWLLPCHDSAGL